MELPILYILLYYICFYQIILLSKLTVNIRTQNKGFYFKFQTPYCGMSLMQNHIIFYNIRCDTYYVGKDKLKQK